MSDPFVGEIRMFAGNFAPRGWAYCDGQLLAVSQNDALFSLLGTIYGGDGRTTFGLPDMRGRIPLHTGAGAGLSPRTIGGRGGTENVTLNTRNLPNHSHTLQATTDAASSADPSGNVLADTADNHIYNTDAPDKAMDTSALANVGGSQSHNNVMPFQCINYIIALVGVYPSRH